MFRQEDIARYYDLSEVHYRRFWNLQKSRSLHYGYWEAGIKNFHEAMLNINKVLAEKAAIRENDAVLDAGCGVGGSSIWLASQKGCTVTGISLSQKQVNTATSNAKEAGVADKVKFEKNNYLQTGYPDGSFDVVWAIESVCHAHDKSEFLNEAFRILKKGGRLIMADFFKEKDLNPKEQKDIKAWAEGWAVDDFSTTDEFSRQIKNAGFSKMEMQNVTNAIKRSARRLYFFYFIGKPVAFFYRLINRNATSFGQRNVETAYLQYKTLKKGSWTYQIVKAIK